jgi:hypothetical protein
MGDHQLNLPWRAEGQTLFDSTGVPVAVVLNYTSIRRADSDGTVYNTSEYAGPLRAVAVCTAMNAIKTDAERIAPIKEILENVRIDHYGADYGCPFIEDIDEVVAAIIAVLPRIKSARIEQHEPTPTANKTRA